MIDHSPLPDVEIPDVTLPEYVLGQARKHRERTALVDATSGERLTYRELAEGVDSAASALSQMGIGPGDVVALISHNQPHYALGSFAALAAGAAVTPMNPALTTDELTKQFLASKAVAVIASEQASAHAGVAADAVGITHRLVLGEADGFRPFSELLTEKGDPPRPALDPSSSLAVLPFSSGTTGLSKGVMLTHRNLVANIAQTSAGWRVTENDVLAAALPFFHAVGFTIVLNAALRAGATAVTLARYQLEAYLQMLQNHRVTRAYLVPPMVLDLATASVVDDYDLSSVRFGLCGAAPLDVDLTRRAEARLGFPIRQGYGMTEASPTTNMVPDAEFATIPAGSVGRLVPSTEARVVDPETGADVATGEPGEMWVRGPQVMAGYLDDPGATAATVVEGGWLRTGDLVRIDDAGLYWVVDRLKELIKYKGFQVAPAELEALLLTHPDVLDVAVIGVPHREGGEAPRAFVVTSGPIDAGTLMAWVAERVAPYKKVRSVEFVDTIPKSANGKILRRLLAAQPT
ncbi:AMP-binding protein [Pseudonocardia alaniniphila]|uniref:AMP-binding protein n=1 Tax=Pseudonocardia alaniniphila TaxID=75291 RepID=A0ABS9TCN8_9PSEU|nr:AMP-binding protein [Pseudonocardia alaniniphila]MCH6166302.1 AMP-binding protein [Pseudonocardia alaniniphila]